jgi:pilus assembly protein CpaC
MLTRLAKFSLFIVLSCSASLHAEENLSDVKNREILMYVGEVKTLSADRIQRIAVGNGKMFTTSIIDNRELLLIAENVGDSSLVVWSGNNQRTVYTVRISQRDSNYAYRNLSAMFKDIPTIQVNTIGTSVVISGTASKENLERVAATAKMFPEAISIAREEEVSMKKMVHMKVQIIEMKKSLSESIGLQWPGSAAGPSLGFSGNFGSTKPQLAGPLKGILPVANNGLLTYLGISSLISTTINLAKNNGDAYVLAEPELSARSGGEAKFLAGGQIPLPSTSALGAGSVEFKDYGIRLSIKPVADDLGNIVASIKTEISSIDPSVSVSGIPGFLTRQSETEINVKNGQTIVMSGLVSNDMLNGASKLPGISNIPVIGHLFRSDNFSSGRTDLVILVTPTITDPSSTINRERLDKGMDIRERFEQKLSNKDIID